MKVACKTHTFIDNGIEASGEICKSSVSASLMWEKTKSERSF